MAIYAISLKLPAICLLSVAFENLLVHGLAVNGPNCGYGYEQCLPGYECVKNTACMALGQYFPPCDFCPRLIPGADTYGSDASSCRTIGYSSTPSYDPSPSSYAGDGYTSSPVYTSDPVYKSPPAYTSSPVYIPTPSYKHSVYPAGYSSSYDETSGYNYGDHSHYTSDYNYGSSSRHYPSPTTIVYPDVSPTYYPESRSGYSSSGIYAPTGYRDYPAPSSPGKNSSDFTAVVGAQPKVVERRSIEVLRKDYKDVFNMLILALESLQNRADTDDLSYYQLSGKR